MTALALALVVCCAMVCGTRLVLRGYDVREAEAQAAISSGGVMRRDVQEMALAVKNFGDSHVALRSEVDSLRAQMALRQV